MLRWGDRSLFSKSKRPPSEGGFLLLPIRHLQLPQLTRSADRRAPRVVRVREHVGNSAAAACSYGRGRYTRLVRPASALTPVDTTRAHIHLCASGV